MRVRRGRSPACARAPASPAPASRPAAGPRPRPRRHTAPATTHLSLSTLHNFSSLLLTFPSSLIPEGYNMIAMKLYDVPNRLININNVTSAVSEQIQNILT